MNQNQPRARLLSMRRVMKPYFSLQDIRSTFALLAPFLSKYRMIYAGLGVLLIADIGVMIVSSWIFGRITESALTTDFNALRVLAVIGACLVLLQVASIYLNTLWETIAVNGVVRGLQEHVFRHLLLMPVSRISNYKTGELMSHFYNDIYSVQGVIGSNLIQLIKLPLIYVTVLAYLLYLNWKLALLSLMIAPVALASGVMLGLVLRRNHRQMHELTASIGQLQSEVFQGTQIVRSFTLERSLFHRYRKDNGRLHNLMLDNARLRGLFFSAGSAAGSIAFFLSLSLGSYFVYKDSLSVGSWLTFMLLVQYVVSPLSDLAALWAGFQRSVTAVERITKVLEEPMESKLLPSYQQAYPLRRSIRFDNLTFAYDDAAKVLDRFDLLIPAGKQVAIVGHSGVGKTTLFQLLLGFYKPQAGCITLDDVPISEIPPSVLRSTVSFVPQEGYLFSGTIRDNLMIARPDASIEEMVEAAKLVHIHDFILTLPDGYDTEVGERGIRLSGGQKQRLAIARAVLKDAPILLLDEATSALDTDTEQAVKQQLERWMAGRTVIVIAHRLSTVRNADLIAVMKEGRVAELGSHEELLALGKHYRAYLKSDGRKERVRAWSYNS